MMDTVRYVNESEYSAACSKAASVAQARRSTLVYNAHQAADFAREAFNTLNMQCWWWKIAQRDYTRAGLSQHAAYCQLRIDSIIETVKDMDI